MKQYSIIIAGSTGHTRICAESIQADARFEISGIITPLPRPIGRKQEITPNPLHQFADTHRIPVVHVDKRIDAVVRYELETRLGISSEATRPDFLLVVDFGYIVPNWLLRLPQVAPINIHPSTLPRWRGSSPGQFVLLYGETQSSISVIVMNDLLDQGDLIAQLPFTVDPSWTQIEYYQAGFKIIAEELPEILEQFAQGHITPQPQPLETPTPIAGRFTKEDGFVPWQVLKTALTGTAVDDTTLTDLLAATPLSPTLSVALTHHRSLARLIYHASHALSPWPGIWTIVPTAKGEKRMKILNTTLNIQESTSGHTSTSEKSNLPTTLVLETIQMEGKEAQPWSTAKNTIL